MGEYKIGKDMEKFSRELEITQGLLQQLYSIVEHNVKLKILKEPPQKKE